MPTYIVSYDLKDAKDYKKMHDAIKLNDHFKVLESLWIVKHKGGASALCKELSKSKDGDDRLFVVEVNDDWAASNLENQPRGLHELLSASS